jgi:hypothetical protein
MDPDPRGPKTCGSGSATLPESVELVAELISGLGDRQQVAEELQVVRLTLQHLHRVKINRPSSNRVK